MGVSPGLIAALIVILTLLTAPAVCSADDYGLTIDLNLTSHHIGNSKYRSSKTGYTSYNERNFGIGFTFKMSDHHSLSFGQFTNSFLRNSNYLSVNMHTQGALKVGVKAGVVDGYSEGYAPYVAPYASVSSGAYTASVSFLPVKFAGLGNANVLTLQISYDIF